MPQRSPFFNEAAKWHGETIHRGPLLQIILSKPKRKGFFSTTMWRLCEKPEPRKETEIAGCNHGRFFRHESRQVHGKPKRIPWLEKRKGGLWTAFLFVSNRLKPVAQTNWNLARRRLQAEGLLQRGDAPSGNGDLLLDAVQREQQGAARNRLDLLDHGEIHQVAAVHAEESVTVQTLL